MWTAVYVIMARCQLLYVFIEHICVSYLQKRVFAVDSFSFGPWEPLLRDFHPVSLGILGGGFQAVGTAGAVLARIFDPVWSDFSLGRHLDQFGFDSDFWICCFHGNYCVWSPSRLQD